MKKLLPCLMAGLLLIGAMAAPAAWAATNILGLEDRGYYDIYIGGDGDNVSIIKNVLITDIKEINGVTFLVIQADSFGKFSTGLVSFVHVRAIIPSHRIAVQGTDNGHY